MFLKHIWIILVPLVGLFAILHYWSGIYDRPIALGACPPEENVITVLASIYGFYVQVAYVITALVLLS